MSTDILPAEWLDGSLEVYLASHPAGAGAVYRLLLAALVVGAGALPILRVEVAVDARGLIRPAVEKHEVVAPAGGVVEAVRVRRGEPVRPGDTLLVLGGGTARARVAAVRARIERNAREVADLARLAADADAVPPASLRSGDHARAAAQLALELRATGRRAAEAAGRLERARALHARSLVPRTELERAEAEVDGLRVESELLRERARARWEAELAAALDEAVRLRVEGEQVAEEADRLVVRAPVAGTVEELASLSRGSFVAAGRTVGVISPDSRLLAEVWIEPRDVGMVRIGSPARVEVHAFDYRDWGFAAGRLIEVSRDFVLVGEEPYFRALVALDRPALRLPGGAAGRLRKGMTVTARFVVAERSLWRLLWDRADDWLDPARSGPRDADTPAA